MVMFTSDYLSRILITRLRKDDAFDEIVSIVNNNAKGNIYLIGGTVSRTLANELYGGKQKNQDYDFVVDTLNDELVVPKGWTISYHKYNNPTFKTDNYEIDIFPLSDHRYIKKNKLEPTINNFLKGVPFTIQALVYDIRKGKLMGEEGIEALKNKILKVHNMDSAREEAERKGVTIDERMTQKAESMGFVIIPYD